ncbi:MAG: hypothetical protein F6K18_16420 [Okeania sp. SIO2C2]|uniref:hypothetical protein n=1 Tax=Okeania sp. SIO2C2 TaxID=2607787 RepID=UPI0013BCD8BD|nr:hypothetical protein [Okeania sp. SIO2C2]NEP88284.1 hypothetical protein [Okeania sp. SIO2C2]
MKKILKLTSVIFILTVGLGIAKTVHSSSNDLIADESHGGMSHSHKKIEIPADKPVPKVDLVAYKDTMKGWNLELKLTNFKFAPETVNQSSNPNEGHAHLYINDKKITRIYSNWYYLGNLDPGNNKITVTLNTNKHEDLVSNSKMIMDTEIIEVTAQK